MTVDRKVLSDRLVALTTEYGAWIKHQRIETVILEVAEALLEPSPEERRMTPKQLDALRMLNDAFESHDGAPVMQAIITRTDYRLLYEALAEGTAGDRIAQELLSPPSPQKEIK